MKDTLKVRQDSIIILWKNPSLSTTDWFDKVYKSHPDLNKDFFKTYVIDYLMSKRFVVEKDKNEYCCCFSKTFND